MRESRLFIGGAADGRLVAVDPRQATHKILVRDNNTLYEATAATAPATAREEHYIPVPFPFAGDNVTVMVEASMPVREAFMRLVMFYRPHTKGAKP